MKRKTIGTILMAIGFSIIITTGIAFYFMIAISYDTKVYTNNIVCVNTNNVVLEDGTILFATNINDHNWKLKVTYEITIEKYYGDPIMTTFYNKSYNKIIKIREIKKHSIIDLYPIVKSGKK